MPSSLGERRPRHCEPRGRVARMFLALRWNQRTSLTVDATRSYEIRRLLPKAARSAGRFRLYPEDAMKRLRFIQLMQKPGFSLQEIGELLELRTHQVDPCGAVKALLKAKLKNVRQNCQCEVLLGGWLEFRSFPKSTVVTLSQV